VLPRRKRPSLWEFPGRYQLVEGLVRESGQRVWADRQDSFVSGFLVALFSVAVLVMLGACLCYTFLPYPWLLVLGEGTAVGAFVCFLLGIAAELVGRRREKAARA
jgi:hypothetical protein